MRSERGASALFIAGAMVLLIGMAAVAIDLGAGFNERRQNQSSADLGVLAGVIDYLDLGLCGAAMGSSEDGGCNEVLAFVRMNVSNQFTEPEWIDAWRNCVDPNKPLGFGPISVESTAWTGFSGTLWNGAAVSDAVDCISVSPQEMRVRVPDQFLNTSFGGVLGVAQLTTNAFAQAALVQPAIGGVLPFGILSNAQGHICLLTAPAGNAEPPCDGSDSGNFFTLRSQTWGPPSSSQTIMNCGNPGDDELAINVALGLDHFISVARDFTPADPANYSFNVNPPGSPDDVASRLDDCDESGGVAVPSDTIPDTGPRDTLLASTGSAVSAPTLKGLINGKSSDFEDNAPNGGTGVVPRLQNVIGCELPGGTTCGTRVLREKDGPQTFNYDINDVPVWDYLVDGIAFTPSLSCTVDGTPVSVSSTDDVDSTEKMQCLLDSYDPSMGVLFSSAIDTNGRFARVPQFYFEEWGSGSHWQPVMGYQMVYLHSIWLVDGGSYYEFEPGESNSPICLGGGPNCAKLALHQLDAFILPHQAVPLPVANNFPGGPNADFEVVLTR